MNQLTGFLTDKPLATGRLETFLREEARGGFPLSLQSVVATSQRTNCFTAPRGDRVQLTVRGNGLILSHC